MRLDHAGVRASDLERSIAFYGQVFGLELEARFHFGDEELAFLRADGGGWIELISTTPSTRAATGVVDHIALEVDDVAAELRRLRVRGVELLDAEPLWVGSLGAKIGFCRGPDGERIELIERAAHEPVR